MIYPKCYVHQKVLQATKKISCFQKFFHLLIQTLILKISKEKEPDVYDSINLILKL